MPNQAESFLSSGSCAGDRPLIGRFAPSPTGRMHAGNIFSALVCWILCKRSGGGVVLRIEDLDRARSKGHYADQLMSDFEQLGLTWDYGPFYQADRDAVYRAAFTSLKERGLIYPCYCTRADLHAASAPHKGQKAPYPGTCRLAREEELEQRRIRALEAGRAPSQRLIVPNELYGLNDAFQGPYSEDLASECGDFVVQRADGSFAYQLAVVIDDAEQGVNLVVRGIDLLSSTPQQIYLQELFGFECPEYAHVPLMMGSDGHRLSKRHADADLEALLLAYGSYEAVLGHIAFVAGIIPSDTPATADELLHNADLRPLQKREEILWR